MSQTTVYLLERIALALETIAGHTAFLPSPAVKKAKAVAPRFIAPALDEVRAYCRERGNNVDPDTFFNYYVSVGWTVGKKPMKDWRAAIRSTWEKNQKSSFSNDKEGRL